MINSKISSNYEEKFINMLKESKILVIDLDGTLINFENVDNAIIHDIFQDNKIIKFIDKILWAVNRLDVFGNGYTGLKLRLYMYSLFTGKNFKKSKEEYKKGYEKYARPELLRSIFNNA